VYIVGSSHETQIETGTDSVMQTIQGDTVAGTYTETDVGSDPESYTLIPVSGSNQVGSSTLGYTMTETANVLSGDFSETLTGADRYSLLNLGGGFKNVADTSGTATPGHLNFSPFGEAYVDDLAEPPADLKPGTYVLIDNKWVSFPPVYPKDYYPYAIELPNQRYFVFGLDSDQLPRNWKNATYVQWDGTKWINAGNLPNPAVARPPLPKPTDLTAKYNEYDGTKWVPYKTLLSGDPNDPIISPSSVIIWFKDINKYCILPPDSNATSTWLVPNAIRGFWMNGKFEPIAPILRPAIPTTQSQREIEHYYPSLNLFDRPASIVPPALRPYVDMEKKGIFVPITPGFKVGVGISTPFSTPKDRKGAGAYPPVTPVNPQQLP
jgi:hypothetical protein